MLSLASSLKFFLDYWSYEAAHNIIYDPATIHLISCSDLVAYSL